MYLPQGTLLHNRYVIEHLLGHGGFGITYAAHDKLLNVRVAIKEYLPRQLATRAEGQTRVSVFTGEARQQYDYGLRKFLEEAQSVARFAHHPNVVSARDYFEANGTAYIVMEYVEGVTLKEYLAKKGGRIAFEEAKGIMMPVMDALREVHQAGMLHRDVSPDNIYITTSAQVKILDFGAARYFAGEQSKSLSVILKQGYAPVEQYHSKGQQGAWTDVYAVGATLYKALTGKTPPEALDRLAADTLEPPSRLGVSISPAAERALLQALAINAGQRFQSMGEFQQALLGGAPSTMQFQPASAPFQPVPDPSYPPGSAPVSAPPQPPVYPPPAAPPPHYPQAPRRSANPAAIAAGVLALVLVVVLVWKLMDRPPQQPVVKAPEAVVQKPVIPPTTPPRVQASPPTMAPDTENRAKGFLEQGPVGGQAVSNNLVFVRNNDVWIATSDGTNARQLTFTGQASTPVLSPDGSLVAFWGPGQKKHETRGLRGVASWKICLIPSQGGNIRDLDLPNLYHLYGSRLNFSPDGKHLLFRCSSRPHDMRNNRGDITVSILMVNWQNLSLQKILSKDGVYDEEDIMTDPAFSPDGNLIVYEETYTVGGMPSGFVIIDLTGKEISRYPFNLSPSNFKIEGDCYMNPSFSPDGQEILCDVYPLKKTANGVRFRNNIIYLVNWRTGAKRKLALGDHATFVDGGKAIVFERNRNSSYISPYDLYRLDLAPGARPRLILRNARFPAGQG